MESYVGQLVKAREKIDIEGFLERVWHEASEDNGAAKSRKNSAIVINNQSSSAVAHRCTRTRLTQHRECYGEGMPLVKIEIVDCFRSWLKVSCFPLPRILKEFYSLKYSKHSKVS